MEILANGDSQTFGHGLADPPLAPSQWPGSNAEQSFAYALSHSWPARLAKRLQCSYRNLARPGGSNDRTVRTTLQQLAQTQDTPLVIIGWTVPHRREVHLRDYVMQQRLDRNEQQTGYYSFLIDCNDMETDLAHDPQAVKWARNYTRYGWDDVESHVRYYGQILLLSSYLKQRNVPYLFFNPTYNPHDWQSKQQDSYAITMTEQLYRAVDWNDFLESDSEAARQMMSVYQHCLDETGHFTMQGHEQIADILHSNIIKRRLIGTESPNAAKR